MKLAVIVVMLMGAAVAARADDVLLWADAKLATDASGAGATLQLSKGKRVLGRAFVMHVVGDAPGDQLEVEIGERGCAAAALRLPDGLASLHLFVAKADLAPAVTRAWSETWKDGGHIDVAAGAPIDLKAKTVRLGADLDFEIPVVNATADRIGMHFTLLPKPPSRDGGPPPYVIRGKASFGGHVLDIDQRPAGLLLANHVTKLPNGKIKVRFGDQTCVTGEVVVHPKQVDGGGVVGGGIEGGDGGGVVGGGMEGGEVGGVVVMPKGTRLTAKSGTHVVATLNEDLDAIRPANPTQPICHFFYLDADGLLLDSAPAKLELCAPASAAKPPH